MSRFLLIAVVAVAGCAPGYDQQISSRAALRFDAELAGRVPGRPQSCLPSRSTANVVAARGGTLIFRDGGAVYANETRGGCSAMADNQYTLVTESLGSSLCSGSLARVVDLTANGVLRGNCVLGDFTPYRRQ